MQVWDAEVLILEKYLFQTWHSVQIVLNHFLYQTHEKYGFNVADYEMIVSICWKVVKPLLLIVWYIPLIISYE